jgi:salicylate hydroxylase
LAYALGLSLADQVTQEFNFLLCVADDNPWKSKKSVTENVTHEAMMTDFEGPGVDDRLRRLLSKANPIKWGLFHHPQTSTYTRDRVVLLGDSAHASLPFQAAGAAQGVEDAVVLSSVLFESSCGRAEDGDLLLAIRAALGAYDSVRRPRAQKQLEQSAEVSRMLFFQHERAGSDMNKILPMLQNGRFNWLWFHDIEKDVHAAMSKMNGGRDT